MHPGVSIICFILIIIVLLVGIWNIVLGYKQRANAKTMGDVSIANSSQKTVYDYGTYVMVGGIVTTLSSIILVLILISSIPWRGYKPSGY